MSPPFEKNLFSTFICSVILKIFKSVSDTVSPYMLSPFGKTYSVHLFVVLYLLYFQKSTKCCNQFEMHIVAVTSYNHIIYLKIVQKNTNEI